MWLNGLKTADYRNIHEVYISTFGYIAKKVYITQRTGEGPIRKFGGTP